MKDLLVKFEGVVFISNPCNDDYLAICINKRCRTHYRYLNSLAATSNILPVTSVVLSIAVFSLSALSLFINIKTINILITCFAAISFLSAVVPQYIGIKNHIAVRNLLWGNYQIIYDGYINGLILKEEAYDRYKKLILLEAKLWSVMTEPSFVLEKFLDEVYKTS